MKWTDEQKKVIKYRNRNILVSAAAGSGKTAVLVERIIKQITDVDHPMDIDKLLVVTFTNAAAAEMKERVGNAIEKLLEESPEDENLKKQETLIHNAQITTIDSFCLFVVRNHFEEIGLEPNFRIADTGELKLLEMDTLNELFEQEYAKGDSAFLKLVDAYSKGKSNSEVKNMVAQIYHQSSSSPWPKEWIAGLAKLYQVRTKEELLGTDMMKSITSYVKVLLSDIPMELEALRSIALQPDGPTNYGETLTQDIESLAKLEELNTFEELALFFKDYKMAGLKAVKNYTGDPLKKEAVMAGRKAIKESLESMQKRYFTMSLDEMVAQLQRMRPLAEELIRLSLAYLDAMDEVKKEKHVLHFSDIEHAALRIFVDENTKELRPTAYDFKKHFAEIMIDEYQDSNQVQEEILCAISRESEGEYNMFMVGDVKQSIYRFRLARPELFMEKFSTYDLEESKKQRIDLHQNFRSRREVLEFTNDIFYKIMAADLGNVTYDADAALYCGASYADVDNMSAEVLLYEKQGEDDFEDGENLNNKQIEARMVADKIIELKKTLQVTDKATGQLRPLRNSDIVILLRSLSGWGNDFASVLEDCGIPAYVSTSTGYFSAVEVQTVLSLLKILDNPYQDIPMAAVLKSAIVGLDNEELAQIAISEGSNSFAEAALQQMEAATEGKLYHFNALFQKMRKKVLDTSIHQLIELVLEETGYDDYVKALPAGAQRSANLNMLIEKAISYEKTSYKGLFHFVRYIDQLQKYEVDFGEADVTDENADVVRLMTIHKSKGLEFPVVFVSGISKKFNDNDSKSKMTIHPDMGLGLDEMQVSPKIKRACLIRSEIADRIRRDNLGEELRVLYVALTRAKEKLILTGVIKNQETIYNKHKGMVTEGKPLSFGQRMKAVGYIDWIVPAVLSYPSKYGFVFKNASDLVIEEARERAAKDLEKTVLLEKISRADESMAEKFKASFGYEYPYKQEAGRKSKYSVSELKHASMVENYDRMEGEVEVPEFLLHERESYVPEFAIDMSHEEADDGNVSSVKAESATQVGSNLGALRGTAVHRVMACLDFQKLLAVDTTSQKAVRGFLETEITRMLDKKLLTPEMDTLVYRNSIIDFLMSSVALRMAQADAKGDLYCEKPFVMDFEGVLLQGIIDVFWLEEGKIVLMDYKTDRVAEAEELLARYATQLELYAKALQRVFSTKDRLIEKTENLIYSFALNNTIPVTTLYDEKEMNII